MRSKKLCDSPKTWALVFDPGDNPVEVLAEFARAQSFSAARVSGVGGFSSVTLGYFNMHSLQYERIPVNEQVEVVSLLGNIALFEGVPRLHAHVVISKRDGSAHGGHLLDAHVLPTLELMLVEYEEDLERTKDPATGLPLLVP